MTGSEGQPFHSVRPTADGATCSCGREFSIWHTTRRPGWSATHDARRSINLVRANANRHAAAANTA